MDYWKCIQTISNFATIIAIIIAIKQYLNYLQKKEENLKRVIGIVRSNIDVIKVWTSLEKGGYPKSREVNTMNEQFYYWGNPFTKVFEIGNNINKIPFLPEFESLSNEINEAIAQVNQQIVSFNSYLDDIKQFKYSDPRIAVSIAIKLKEKLQNFDDCEKDYIKMLVEMYRILHFEMIGDENKRGLYYYSKEVDNLIKKEEGKKHNKIKNLYFFYYLFLFFILFTIITPFVYFYFFNLSNLSIYRHILFLVFFI
jgi:hypothetical protein